MYIISAVLAFSLLIIWHELGHFLMAKANGVKVEEFSLGMGPKLFGIKGKETEYLIKALPIGGYVKMLGEEGESNDPRAFASKSPKQKLSIVIAGPIMNLILTVILLAIVHGFMGYLTPVVNEVVPNSPAAIAGIESGDKLIKANNEEVKSWDDFLSIMQNFKGDSINVEVERNNDIKEFTLNPNKVDGRYIIGISATQKKLGFGQSIQKGFSETGKMMKMTLGFFGTLVKGEASANDIGGPVTIIRLSTEMAKQGLLTLGLFTAFLSVQLGIFNLLPIPALDGGWVFFLLFEIISGKKLDESKVGTINYIGFMILISLMILVIIKDIVNPVQF